MLRWPTSPPQKRVRQGFQPEACGLGTDSAHPKGPRRVPAKLSYWRLRWSHVHCFRRICLARLRWHRTIWRDRAAWGVQVGAGMCFLALAGGLVLRVLCRTRPHDPQTAYGCPVWPLPLADSISASSPAVPGSAAAQDKAPLRLNEQCPRHPSCTRDGPPFPSSRPCGPLQGGRLGLRTLGVSSIGPP